MTVLSYPNPNNVPSEIKNAALKYAYTYILQELLRLKHNEVGAPYGLQADPLYAELQQLRQSLGDKEQIASLQKEINTIMAPFRVWEKEWFNPRSETIINDLTELRSVIKGYVEQYRDKINLEDIPV